jgi:hypothetical protein
MRKTSSRLSDDMANPLGKHGAKDGKTRRNKDGRRKMEEEEEAGRYRSNGGLTLVSFPSVFSHGALVFLRESRRAAQPSSRSKAKS